MMPRLWTKHARMATTRLGSALVSTWLLGGLTGALCSLAASPYLARISVTVADRGNPRWWHGAVPSPGRLVACAAVGAGLGALAGHAAGWSAFLPALLALALFATPLLLADIEHHRLPDRLMLPAVLSAVALLTATAAVRGDWHALGRAVAAAGVVFVAFAVIALASPASIGFGDVKLAGLLAAYLGWLSWTHVLYGIFAGFVLGALVALPLLVARRVSLKTTIALGPALIVGALLVASLH